MEAGEAEVKVCSGLWSGFHDPVVGEHRMVRVGRQRKQERPEAKAALPFESAPEAQQLRCSRRLLCARCWGHSGGEAPGGGWWGAERSPAQALGRGSLQEGVRCEACFEVESAGLGGRGWAVTPAPPCVVLAPPPPACSLSGSAGQEAPAAFLLAALQSLRLQPWSSLTLRRSPPPFVRISLQVR